MLFLPANLFHALGRTSVVMDFQKSKTGAGAETQRTSIWVPGGTIFMTSRTTSFIAATQGGMSMKAGDDMSIWIEFHYSTALYLGQLPLFILAMLWTLRVQHVTIRTAEITPTCINIQSTTYSQWYWVRESTPDFWSNRYYRKMNWRDSDCKLEEENEGLQELHRRVSQLSRTTIRTLLKQSCPFLHSCRNKQILAYECCKSSF